MSDKLTAERLRAIELSTQIADIIEKKVSGPQQRDADARNAHRLDQLEAAHAILKLPAILAMAEVHARMQEDAARYHWLRDHSCPPHNFYIGVPDEFAGERYGPSEVDAYVDAARRALGKDQA